MRVTSNTPGYGHGMQEGSQDDSQFALVLGAGGTVGMAYHAGTLKALKEVSGVDATEAALIVGTSAGSVVAAYLRSGWSVDDLWELALGTHPSVADLTPEEREAERRAHLVPTWGNPVDLIRRSVGSAAVMAQTMLPFVPRPPAAIGRRFPGGLYSMEGARKRFEAEVGTAWPDRPTYLCASNLRTGRRVVFGAPDGPAVDLPTAVMASCAIPGFFEPVRAGDAVLVDGGVLSTTHLDLAAVTGHRRIIAVAPMAFDPAAAPANLAQLSRRRPARALAREARMVKRLGAELVLVRPCAEELRVHGRNLMNPDVGEDVARSAYECAARQLDELATSRSAA